MQNGINKSGTNNTTTPATGTLETQKQNLHKNVLTKQEESEVHALIENMVKKNQHKLSSKDNKVKARKSGIGLPLFINIFAIILIVSGAFALQMLFNTKQEILLDETASSFSSEESLLSKVREQTEADLQAKEAEINRIQKEMADLDKKQNELESEMNERMARERDKYREQLEAELSAERQQMQSQGLSENEINNRIAQIETARQQEAAEEIARFRQEMLTEIQRREEEIKKAKERYQNELGRAAEEVKAIQAQADAREDELREQYEKERAELAEQASDSQKRLEALKAEREKERLILSGLKEGYYNIQRHIQNGEYPKAENQIRELRNLLYDESVMALPSMTQRRELELATIDTLQTMLTKQKEMSLQLANIVETRAAADESAGTSGDPDMNETRTVSSGIAETAGILSSAQQKIAKADRLYESGKTEEARNAYEAALSSLPEVRKAHNRITQIKTAESTTKQNEAIADRDNSITALEKELAAAQKTIDNYEDLLSKEGTTIEEYNTIIKNRSQQISLLENRVNELEQENAQLNSRLDAVNTEKVSMEAALSDYEGNSTYFKDQLEKTEKALLELDKRVSEARFELSESQAKNEELTGQVALLESRNTELNSKLEALTSENSLLSAERNSLTETLTEKVKTIEELNNTINELETQLASLSVENPSESTASIEPSAGMTDDEKALFEAAKTVQEDYARYRNSGRASYSQVLEGLTRVFSTNQANTLLPGFAAILQTIPGMAANQVKDRYIAQGRSRAFDDITAYFTALTPESSSDVLSYIEQLLQRDVAFNRTVSVINSFLENRGIDTEARGVKQTEFRFVGLVVSFFSNTVYAELLVTTPLEESAAVLIKRSPRDSSGSEVDIASGRVISSERGNATIRIEEITEGYSIESNDLVYLVE